jgi:hypothetical protein
VLVLFEFCCPSCACVLSYVLESPVLQLPGVMLYLALVGMFLERREKCLQRLVPYRGVHEYQDIMKVSLA